MFFEKVFIGGCIVAIILKYVVSMGLYFVFLLALVEVMRKHYKMAHVVWIASLLTFPIWLMGGVVGWFRWAKIISVIIPTIFVGFVRIASIESKEGKWWSKLRQQWPMKVLYCVLFLNIFEATMKDIAMGNYFNAISGALLCVTIPFTKKYWGIAKEKPGDLIVFTTLGWNLMYTTWNACFVFAETPVYFASSLCIILAAEIYPIIKKRPELYVMSRVYTLAAHLIIRSCFVGLFPAVMNASSWQNPSLLHNWGMVNAIMMIGYSVWHFRQIRIGKDEAMFKRGNLGLTI